MPDRQRAAAARDAWLTAEKAYHDELAKYVGAAWLTGQPPPDDQSGEALTPEAQAELTRLRNAADEAVDAYLAES